MLCHDHDRFNEPLRFAGYEPNVVNVEIHNDTLVQYRNTTYDHCEQLNQPHNIDRIEVLRLQAVDTKFDTTIVAKRRH
jgi:hypothetical protein